MVLVVMGCISPSSLFFAFSPSAGVLGLFSLVLFFKKVSFLLNFFRTRKTLQKIKLF